MHTSENTSDAQNFNPLKEAVEHKPQKQVHVDPNLLMNEIPEPVINLTSVQNEEDIFAKPSQKATEQKANDNKKPVSAFNPELNDIPASQKRQAAENFAGMIWGGYQKLHDWGNGLLTISDRKIINWQTTGEVDLTIPVPFTSTEWMPMAEFIQEYNKQAEKTFTISPDWKDEINPVLVRVLEKYGHGLTDEQFLVSMFAQDAIFKVAKGYQMKAITKSIIDFAKEQTKNTRMGVEPPAVTQPASTASAAPAMTSQEPDKNPETIIQAPPDAQSQAVADLVVGANQPVQQAVPVFGNTEHLTRAKKISEVNKVKGKRGRKPKKADN